MRLAFMGTSSFAVPSLGELVSSGHRVEAVFTQPDRPSGRGRKLHVSPVKEAAMSLGLNLHQPESLQSDSVRKLFNGLAPEIIVVVAYGKILPRWLIDCPRHGVVNLHGSLLPKYRGAAPINWAIATGESRTGVCTMQIDEGLDTGPVYSCEQASIGPDATAPELSVRLALLGAPLLARTVETLGRSEARPTPQDDREATLAPRLTKEDGHIRWEEPGAQIHNKVRAFVPWPSVVVGFRQKSCRILETRLTRDVAKEFEPGTIVAGSRGLRVSCGDHQLLAIERLQLENRKAVSGSDFANGVHLRAGERFTTLAGES